MAFLRRSREWPATLLLLVGVLASGAHAQVPPTQDHEQHHPPDATPPPATSQPRPVGPAPRPDVPEMGPQQAPEMMRAMEHMMGAPPKKPIASRLLDVERLSEAERATLREEAARQMESGMQTLQLAARELEAARLKGDAVPIQRAIARQREGAALWETGHAVHEALAAPAAAARAAGVRWFKAQMNLEAPPPLPSGLPWGLSWVHLISMAAVALFAAVGLALYAYRVRHALRLLARLTRRDAPR